MSSKALRKTATQSSTASGEEEEEVTVGLSNVKLSKTNTTSSTASSSSSGSNKSSFHSLIHKKKPSLPPTLEIPSTPIGLAELCVRMVLTVPGPPLDVLQHDIMPRLYHSAYVHRVNSREIDLAGLVEVVGFLRSRFRSIRVRPKSSLMDTDGTATMKSAAVGLTYDILGIAHDAPKHVDEERRMAAMCVFKIFDGRVAQADLVLDTKQFQLVHEPKQLDCVLM